MFRAFRLLKNQVAGKLYYAHVGMFFIYRGAVSGSRGLMSLWLTASLMSLDMLQVSESFTPNRFLNDEFVSQSPWIYNRQARGYLDHSWSSIGIFANFEVPHHWPQFPITAMRNWRDNQHEWLSQFGWIKKMCFVFICSIFNPRVSISSFHIDSHSSLEQISSFLRLKPFTKPMYRSLAFIPHLLQKYRNANLLATW